MFGNLSEYPRKIWDGLKGLSPQSLFQREVGGNPAPTGQDFGQVCDEVVKIEDQCLGLHSYVVKVDNDLQTTKDDLQKQIKEIELTPGESIVGPEGKQGPPGESIVGPEGKQGPPGESIVGPKGDDAPIPEFVWDNDILKIIVDDKTILSPHLRGPAGKSVPSKRISGMGGLSGGSGPALRGEKGDKGDSGGGGVTPFTCETDDDIKTGQFIYIHYSGHAKLAKADAGSTIAVGCCNADTLANHAVEYITDTSITQDDWSNVIEDGSSTLTIGVYFLSNITAGKITQVCPTTGIVQRVGRALSPTCFDLEITGGITL